MLRQQFDFVKLMELVALTLYSAFSAFLLVHFQASIVVVMAVLSVAPIVVLWRLERLNTRLIPVILLLTLGLTAIFEATAYVNGIWYEITPSEWRLFDLVPFEAFVAAFVHTLYFVVVYEYFLDDQKTSRPVTSRLMVWLLGLAATLFAAGVAYLYLFSGAIIEYSFAWLLIAASAVFAGAVALVRAKYWKRVLAKTAMFATVIYPISLIYEYVALSNNLRFFANVNDYVYAFQIFGQPLPLEELLFIWLIPFWLAALYEMYVDDGQ